MTDVEHKHLWNRRCDLLYRAELSTLYHRKRARFFALLDRWDKIFTLLFGSAAFAQVITLDRNPWLALPFVVLAFASLIFDFSESARRHGELASSFKMLESTIEGTGERDFTESDLNAWSARLREIESGETSAYSLLVRICQNEIARSRGDSADVTYIPFWRACLANVVPFSNYEIKHKRQA
ncbi:hypothetical protein KTE96_23675 [Burkholderia multivorans]|uniref:hypothetical protein n=1 Tax=Burkholderia multivorans TaxID=87883 RepID=UPI001C21F43B|nr:hypothetical protein [Burkholderia multivorans]MBU9614739.1 hypothetical protein [Burkholderia multivorans]